MTTGADVIIYELHNMTHLDKKGITSFRVQMGARVCLADGTFKSWKSESSSFGAPTFVGHGASTFNGLAIVTAGGLPPTEGITGFGIYCFTAGDRRNDEDATEPAISTDAIEELWQRSVTGGYNRGVYVFCHA